MGKTIVKYNILLLFLILLQINFKEMCKIFL